MTVRTSVTVKGQDRLVATARLAGVAMGTGYRGAEADIGRRGADLARGRAPRRTGRLASTIAADAAEVSVGTAYAPALEYGVGPRPGRRGGHNIRARRFMRGAFEAVRPYAIGQVEKTTHRIVGTIRGA